MSPDGVRTAARPGHRASGGFLAVHGGHIRIRGYCSEVETQLPAAHDPSTMSILEDAASALATGPLCDACLGRLFAERSFGLANAERGHALRVSLALEEDEPFEASEDCWVCELESERVDWWAEQAATAVRGYDFNT